MNTEHTQALETIIAKGGFAAKVAQTVLTTNKCSQKQFEILDAVSPIYLDLNELDVIDATNLKHDAAFEEMQKKAVKNQSAGL